MPLVRLYLSGYHIDGKVDKPQKYLSNVIGTVRLQRGRENSMSEILNIPRQLAH